MLTNKLSKLIGSTSLHGDKGYFGHDTKGIGGTMDRSVRNHKLYMESVKKSWNIKEEITCGISICNHEKTVSFFTCHGYNSEEGKGEVHVCMFCVQCTCIEDHQWIA